MRKLITVLIMALAIVGCTKDGASDVDAVVGFYKITVQESATWGAVHVNTTDSGALRIEKTGVNTVIMSGFFTPTKGTVVGNTIMFEPTISTDADGTLITDYNSCSVIGNVLKISMTINGSLKDKGVAYPFNAIVLVSGTKQN